ncbi:MAG: MoaD/ThiS family protein [Candidatus Aminicenantes bacterium]|nr:MoaD/ThiS family protein [Candidatus Aminicenantes bacterium]
MLIHIRLLGSFAKFGSKLNDGMLNLEMGACIKDVIDELRMPSQNIMLVLINGHHASLNAELSEGDIVQIFPPVGGG